MCGELIKISETARKQRGYSIIHWNTGEPKENGSYLVTISGLDSIYVICAVYLHETGWCYRGKEEIIAWCKLSDIKPYKEETK